MAACIAPNVTPASEAGLAVKRGVVVDDRMRTSDPVIFAAGDVAELEGRITGLWPVAVEQAEGCRVQRARCGPVLRGTGAIHDPQGRGR